MIKSFFSAMLVASFAFPVSVFAQSKTETMAVAGTSAINPAAEHIVQITTDFGVIKVKLYNETPLHRDNFLKLVKQGYYDDLLFHRVIRNFMIQGGDPDSKGATAGKKLGDGGPDYTIPAEIVQGKFHKKGALAAAREGDDVNPKKESSGSQFYIVQGFVNPDAGMLDKRYPNKKYSDEQKAAYSTIGGAAHLDGDYTVFGEVIEGLEVLDKIAVVPTTTGTDRPVSDVKMKLKVIK